MRHRLGSLILIGSLFALGVVPAAFAANDPTGSVYGGSAGNVQQDIASGSLGDGTLPFTGMNLVLIALAGVALIATGILLKRRSSSSKS